MISRPQHNRAIRAILAVIAISSLLMVFRIASLDSSSRPVEAAGSIPGSNPQALIPEVGEPPTAWIDGYLAVADRHPGIAENASIEKLAEPWETRIEQDVIAVGEMPREAPAVDSVRAAPVPDEPPVEKVRVPGTIVSTAIPTPKSVHNTPVETQPLFSARRPRAVKVAQSRPVEPVTLEKRSAAITADAPATVSVERYQRLNRRGEIVTAEESWSCVRDNRSDLVWEVKTDDGGLHDAGHLYSWYDPSLGRDAGVRDGGRCAGGVDCDTHAYQTELNRQGLCGVDEWRLPGKQELLTLVALGDRENSATIDKEYFPRTASSWYWTASSNDKRPGYAWYVLFRNGIPLNDLKARPKHIRLVSGTRLIMASRN